MLKVRRLQPEQSFNIALNFFLQYILDFEAGILCITIVGKVSYRKYIESIFEVRTHYSCELANLRGLMDEFFDKIWWRYSPRLVNHLYQILFKKLTEK